MNAFLQVSTKSDCLRELVSIYIYVPTTRAGLQGAVHVIIQVVVSRGLRKQLWFSYKSSWRCINFQSSNPFSMLLVTFVVFCNHLQSVRVCYLLLALEELSSRDARCIRETHTVLCKKWPPELVRDK